MTPFKVAIPSWVWLALAGTVALGLAHCHGRHIVQKKWDESIARGKVLVEAIESKQLTVNMLVDTKVEYRERVITEKGAERIKIQEVFVPIDSGYLSGGFRLFYDAAVRGTIPDPSGIATAAPVAVTDVASTTSENFDRCAKAYARVELWEEWADEQEQASRIK